MSTHRRRFLSAAAGAALAFAFSAHAQEWPTKPVQWILPFAAGGPADIIARTVQPKLAEALGQPVVIENKAGGRNNIAHAEVARAAPDGYTILYVVPSVVTNPLLYRGMVDPLKDLAPLTIMTSQSYVVVASSAFAPKTLPEVIAKAKSGGVICASGGGLMGFGCEWLKTLTQADFVHVQYKGNAPAMTDLLGGRANILFNLFNTSLPQISAGKIHPIATTGAKRGHALPNVPTLSETLPGFVIQGWHGVMLPVGVPRPVVDKLNRAFRTALADPAVVKPLEDAYSDVTPTTPEEFGRILREDYAKYARIVKDAGIKVE